MTSKRNGENKNKKQVQICTDSISLDLCVFTVLQHGCRSLIVKGFTGVLAFLTSFFHSPNSFHLNVHRFPLLIKQHVPWFSNKEWLRPLQPLWLMTSQSARKDNGLYEWHAWRSTNTKKLCYQHTVVEIRTERRGWNARQRDQRLDDDYSLGIKNIFKAESFIEWRTKDKISRHKTKLDVWKPMQWKRLWNQH